VSTVILSAASPELPSLQALAAVLSTELALEGETEVRRFELSTMKLAYCQGEFDCWVKTPGICRAADAEHDIVAAIHDADNLILLDAVTFGGHSFTLKRAQDRLICLLTPFFETRSALTHHGHRYATPANLFALGWLAEPDAAQAQTWLALADANAINLVAPRVGAVVVDDARREAWPGAIRAMLSSNRRPGRNIGARRVLRGALLEAARPDLGATPPARVRTAALLVGSAKPRGTSTSENLARALAARLARQGVATELHFATEFVHDGGSALIAARAIADADLVVLAAPLYVDSLPALATHALELVAKLRPPGVVSGQFMAVMNCGFPEPEQNRTALRIARHFCARAGYRWAGGLPLGGGGTVNPEIALDAQHGPVQHVKRALDAAAPPLARGEGVPPAALALMMKSAIPDAVYRVMGDLGWRYRAHRNGLRQRALRARPLDRAAARHADR